MLRRQRIINASHFQPRRWSSTANPRKVSDPLRILFCGSDEFSASSLSALCLEHATNPSLIKSIDVVVRPPKPTGRGYKVLREVPLQSIARELSQTASLPIHTINTFTGWTPPTPYNLIIAVSFGLFVPPRILNSARYGGLNIHPSLLPDLRGPAPLHHALLSHRTHTGVSLQTLSPDSFDSGEILAQTPLPGIPITKGMTVPLLRDLLAAEGASMLIAGLRAGVHVPPRQDVGWVPTTEELQRITHAPKITKRESEVQWGDWTPKTMVRRERVLDNALWSRAVARDGKTKRVMFRGVEEVPASRRPAVVERYLAGGAGERKAMKDEGLVRFVAWRRSDPEVVDGVDENNKPRFTVVPYFLDDAVEHAVVLPFDGGGCVRIKEVKLEGGTFSSAASGFKTFSYTSDEFRELKDDPKSGGSGFDYFQVEAIGSSALGLLDGLLD